MRRVVIVVLAVLAAGFLAIQLVPYGRDHANPPVTAEPAWDSPRTRELFMAACGDCHSNETAWPWYTSVAPISWRVQRHVDEGREQLNVSAWGRGEQEAGEAAEQVRSGEMPPSDYLLLHPEARLSAADTQALVDGLVATFGGDDEGGSGDGEDEGEEGDDD